MEGGEGPLIVARLSCYALEACCTEISVVDALSSLLLLDSLYISSPNKPMSQWLSLGLFFGLTKPPPTLSLESAGMQLHTQ